MTKIAYVENHIGFRSLIVRYLETLPIEYKIWKYDNGKEFTIRFPIENYLPDIVLMDVRMPEMDGYETTSWMSKNYPSVPVLIFSDINGPNVIVSLVRSGAKGHISKHVCLDDNRLQVAIEKIINGDAYYDDPDMYCFVKKRLLMSKKEIKEGIDSLTKDEMKVVRYLIQEGTYSECAKKLCISQDTYKSRLGNIFKKMGVKTTCSLRRIAYEIGLIEN